MKRLINQILICFLLIGLFISFPVGVLAQDEKEEGVEVGVGDYDLKLGVFNPLGGWGNVGILSLLSMVALFAFMALIVLWIFIAIFAGIKMIRSQGNPDMIKGGSTTIKNMLAGVSMGLAFFIAVSILGSFAGVGNIFEWADSFQECSCESAGDSRCFQYKFQAEASVEDEVVWRCQEAEGQIGYGLGWFDPQSFRH